MSFDFSSLGLPANKKWEDAANTCHAWLTQHMSMFGPERINNFMHNQPGAAAKRIFDHCPGWSEECITVLLMGPAKGNLVEDPAAAAQYGDRAVALVKTLINPKNALDAQMLRDAQRIFIAEGISTMNDQMVDRKRIDAHHQTRWKILGELEEGFKALKGQDTGLDALFEDAFAKSKAALTKLDVEAAAKKLNKPPGM